MEFASLNKFTPIWSGTTTSETAKWLDCPIYGCDLTKRLARFIKVGDKTLSELNGNVALFSFDKTARTVTFSCSYTNGAILFTSDRRLTLKYANVTSINATIDDPTFSFVGGQTIRNGNAFLLQSLYGIVNYRDDTSFTPRTALISDYADSVSVYYELNGEPLPSNAKMTFDKSVGLVAKIYLKNKWNENSSEIKTVNCFLEDVSLVLDTSDLDDPLIWSDSQTDFQNDRLGIKLVSGTEEMVISYEDCTFTSYPAVDKTSDVVYTITCETEEIYQTIYTNSYTVRAIPNEIREVVPNGSDTTHYYTSWKANFVLPSFSFTAYKYDGVTSVIVYADDSDMHFYNDSNYLNELDTSKVVSKTDYIYFEYKGIRGRYAVIPQPVTVMYFDKAQEITLTRGRVLNDYTFKMQATFNDGTVIEDFKDFTIKNGNQPILETGGSAPVTFAYNGVEQTLPYALKNPTIKGFEIIDNGSIDTTINDGRDRFDITKTKCQISYQDEKGDIGYKTKCDYASSLAKGKFTATPSDDSFTPIDGSSVIDMGLSGAKQTVNVVLDAYNEFDTTQNAPSITIPVSVTSITSIKYISATVQNLRTEYKVGDTFLDDNDTSSVTYGYDDGNGNILSEQASLSTSSSLFNISPMPGTKLTSTGSKTVTVRSIFDSSVIFEYSITIKPNVSLGVYNYHLKPYRLPSDHIYTFFRNHVKTKEITLKAGTYVLVDADKLTKKNGIVELNGDLATEDMFDDENIGDMIRTNGVQIYGYLEQVNKETDSGKVVLFRDYKTPVSGESNIKVKFPCYDSESSSFVNKCTFGVRFGHNNSLNRLFLSGNPDKPNFDIHSVEPFSEDSGRAVEGDFSYFPDEAMTKYGESDNEIVGYDVVSESKLLVLKNKAGKERTIYFRYPKQVNSLDSSGIIRKDINGDSIMQEEYGIAMSNSPIAGISPKTIANFNGDTLFVSNENQIVGLDIEGIIGDSQRQANTRSAYCDPKLKQTDLSDSVLFTTGDYAFFETKDGMYVSYRGSRSSETNNYEWLPCDKTNANMFFEDINGNVFFGNKNGSFYKLTRGQYSDTERLFLNNDQSDIVMVRVSNTGGYLIVGESISSAINTNYKAKIKKNENEAKNNFYERILDIGSGMPLEVYGDSILKMKADSGYAHLLSRIVEGEDYYLCPNQSSSISLDEYFTTAYKGYAKFHLIPLSTDEIEELNDSEPGYAYFHLADSNGDIITDLSGINACGIAKVMDGEYDIINIVGNSLYIGINKKPTWITRMDKENTLQNAVELTEYKTICSKFITAPFLIDSPNYMKSVMKIDLLNATLKPCDLQVSVVSNKTVQDPTKWDIAFKDKNEVYSFDSLSFDSTTFSKNIVPTVYSVKHFFPKQRFFCLAFISNYPKNSVLPGVEITYTINGFAKASQ